MKCFHLRLVSLGLIGDDPRKEVSHHRKETLALNLSGLYYFLLFLNREVADYWKLHRGLFCCSRLLGCHVLYLARRLVLLRVYTSPREHIFDLLKRCFVDAKKRLEWNTL